MSRIVWLHGLQMCRPRRVKLKWKVRLTRRAECLLVPSQDLTGNRETRKHCGQLTLTKWCNVLEIVCLCSTTNSADHKLDVEVWLTFCCKLYWQGYIINFIYTYDWSSTISPAQRSRKTVVQFRRCGRFWDINTFAVHPKVSQYQQYKVSSEY